MPNDKPESESDRIIDALSDADAMRKRGVSEEWIENCTSLVNQYRRLQSRFRELESELSRPDAQSSPSDDTIVF